MNTRYCEDCEKLMNFIGANFISEHKRYRKFVCRSCDIVHKEFKEEVLYE